MAYDTIEIENHGTVRRILLARETQRNGQTQQMLDVSHRVLPVDERMARDMLQELKAFPLLTGYRAKSLGDVDATCKAIAGFSSAVLALQEQADEVEINPLLVKEKGHGVRMLDALVISTGK